MAFEPTQMQCQCATDADMQKRKHMPAPIRMQHPSTTHPTTSFRSRCATSGIILLVLEVQEEDKKLKHWAQHGDTSSVGQRNGGAHWAYLARLLKKNAPDGKSPIVGDKISIADIVLFDIADLYLRVFETEMRNTVRMLVPRSPDAPDATLSCHCHLLAVQVRWCLPLSPAAGVSCPAWLVANHNIGAMSLLADSVCKRCRRMKSAF